MSNPTSLSNDLATVAFETSNEIAQYLRDFLHDTEEIVEVHEAIVRYLRAVQVDTLAVLHIHRDMPSRAEAREEA